MKRSYSILASALALILCVSALNPAAYAAFSALWRSAPAGGAGMGAPAPRTTLDAQGLLELRADRAKPAASFAFSPALLARISTPVPPVAAGPAGRGNETHSLQDGLRAVRLARAPPRSHS